MSVSKAEIDAIPFTYDIRFVDSEASPAASFQIQEHLVKLHRIYGRITDCRVAVGVLHNQSATRSYNVHIQLDVPGTRLAISRDPKRRDDHLDVRTAINDAFHKVTRQLEDYVRARREAKVEARA